MGSSPAFALEHGFETPEGVAARQKQLYFVHGEDLVVLALTCAEAEHAMFGAQLEAIAESVRLQPRKSAS